MIFKISKEAKKDLEQIWLYTFENWSDEQADRYINLIFDEIEFIVQYPHSGIDYNAIRKGYFKSRVKSHFIFYKINSKENTIEIIRIMHQVMDIDKGLNE